MVALHGLKEFLKWLAHTFGLLYRLKSGQRLETVGHMRCVWYFSCCDLQLVLLT